MPDTTASTPPPAGADPAPKPARARSLRPLVRLAPFVARYPLAVAVAAVALIVAAGFSLSLPMGLRFVVDGFSKAGFTHIGRAFALLLACVGGLAVFSALRFYCVSWLGERVVADLRRAVFDHITTLSPAFFELTRTGEVLSRLTTDTTVIQGVIGWNVSIALRSTLTVIGGIALLLITNAKLTGIFFVLGPALIVPLMLTGRRLRKLSRDSQDRVADASATAGELIEAMPTVQAYGQEPHERARFGATAERAFAAAKARILTRSLLTMGFILLVFGGGIGVLWLGVQDVLAGRTTNGALVQFILYAAFVGGSAAGLTEVWGELQRASGSAERLFELLSVASEIRAPAAPAPLPASSEVAFESVTFRYPTRPEASALHDLSLRVAPGETVAFVGPSGAGKSTIFRLLLRFYDPQAGALTLGRTDLRALDPAALRTRFALVSQDPVIFSGTIADNIGYGRAGASQREIEEAARAANAHGFVMRLSAGYQAMLGERGITLSGGERQRIALARAFLRDAPILLLDEPTSALDSLAEAEIEEALVRLSHGRTCLIIAHRLATVRRADRILVIEDGRLIGEGTHGELMTGSGLYAKLARLQLMGDAPARANAGE
jgi:ATP-binding cassette subfamily B protein